ncbi:MAG: hypothetical protein ABIJ19_01800 [Patescibacteria group bacterium]
MSKIIQSKRSVIVAADVLDITSLGGLAAGMKGVAGIGGFKIGLALGLKNLKVAVSVVKRILGSDFPVIYDHQKGGNDIPEMGTQFAKVLKESEVDAAILFPFAGPTTQEMWTKSCLDAGLQVLTGGVMTHSKFLVSEDGYIADESVEKIYRLACKLGIRHFVVPGNKIEWVKKIRSWLVEELGEGNFVLYAPGFITQKGDISECGQAAGDEWHAIVGSAIYKQSTMEQQRQAAIEVTSQIAI